MAWYLWILVVILGLNVLAIGMLSVMMLADYFAQRRFRGPARPQRERESEEE
jgi:hypothetical protein